MYIESMTFSRGWTSMPSGWTVVAVLEPIVEVRLAPRSNMAVLFMVQRIYNVYA